MKNIQSHNKKWIAFFSAISILCVAVILLFSFLPMGHTAVIFQDGKEIQRIRLDLVTESYTIPLENNVILVEPGQISMQSANCPDQICIHQGTLKQAGRIVCLPNRVMIEMVHEKNAPDAKVG